MRTQFIIDADIPEDRAQEMVRNLTQLTGVVSAERLVAAREVPEDIRASLDRIEQSVGELLYLRRVIESIKAANATLLDVHAKRVAEEMGVTASPEPHRALENDVATRYLMAVRYLALEGAQGSKESWVGTPSICRAMEIAPQLESSLRNSLRAAGFVQDTTTSGANPLVRLTEAGWIATEKLAH